MRCCSRTSSSSADLELEAVRAVERRPDAHERAGPRRHDAGERAVGARAREATVPRPLSVPLYLEAVGLAARPRTDLAPDRRARTRPPHLRERHREGAERGLGDAGGAVEAALPVLHVVLEHEVDQHVDGRLHPRP